MKYTKPALTLDAQVSYLKTLGLAIPDEARFKHGLEQIGFYRLKGYMYPYRARQAPHEFAEGTDADAILRLYAFDKALRIILLRAIETIEIALRASIANITSLELGPFWYVDETNFYDRDKHNILMAFVDENMRNSTEDYLTKFRHDFPHSQYPPIWMMMEFMTLGKLSNLFEHMKDSESKKKLSAHWQLPSTILVSWLKSLNYLRNCCAHHARVWNRRLALKPMLPTREKYRVLLSAQPDSDKMLFGLLSCMLYLLRVLGNDAELRTEIHHLLRDYPMINRRYMGFQENWAEEPIWQAA